MNTLERVEALDGALVFDPTFAAVGDRTLEILARRGRGVHRRRRILRLVFVPVDAGAIVLAFVVTQLVLGETAEWSREVSRTTELLFLAATLPVWLFVARLYGLYRQESERAKPATTDELGDVFHTVAVGLLASVALLWATRLGRPSAAGIFVLGAAAVGFVCAGRSAARALVRRRLAYVQNTIVVGAGDVGQLVARKLAALAEQGINVVGFVDAAPKARRADLDDLVLLGGPGDLPELVRRLDVERVLIAFSNESDCDMLELVRTLAQLEVQIDIVPRYFEVIPPNAAVHAVGGIPLVGLRPKPLGGPARICKRAMDVSFAAVSLVLLSPLFLLAALAIKLDSPGPVYFRQIRMGTGNRPFRIFKFRTMVADADERKPDFAHLNAHDRNGGDPRMFKIENDPRVTRVGRFLRRYYLDELPQLVNVVRGDMSLVGPRPLILEEDGHVQGWARARVGLRPGMTGLWQVLGRSSIPFEEMVKLDYVYVMNWSPWADVLLLLRTVPLVLRGEATRL